MSEWFNAWLELQNQLINDADADEINASLETLMEKTEILQHIVDALDGVCVDNFQNGHEAEFKDTYLRLLLTLWDEKQHELFRSHVTDLMEQLYVKGALQKIVVDEKILKKPLFTEDINFTQEECNGHIEDIISDSKKLKDLYERLAHNQSDDELQTLQKEIMSKRDSILDATIEMVRNEYIIGLLYITMHVYTRLIDPVLATKFYDDHIHGLITKPLRCHLVGDRKDDEIQELKDKLQEREERIAELEKENDALRRHRTPKRQRTGSQLKLKRSPAKTAMMKQYRQNNKEIVSSSSMFKSGKTQEPQSFQDVARRLNFGQK